MGLEGVGRRYKVCRPFSTFQYTFQHATCLCNRNNFSMSKMYRRACSAAVRDHVSASNLLGLWYDVYFDALRARSIILTLGAHAQRGLQYLLIRSMVCVSTFTYVCTRSCLVESVGYAVLCPYYCTTYLSEGFALYMRLRCTTAVYRYRYRTRRGYDALTWF